VRLATWNLHGSAEPDARAVAAMMQSFRLDLVAAQETRRHQIRALDRLVRWPRGYWSFKHNGWYGLPRRSEGLALLSSHPTEQRMRTTLSTGEPWWKYTRRIAQRASIDGVVVVNAHLASHDNIAARAAQVERLITFARGADVLAGDLNDIPAGPALTRLREAGWFDVFDCAGAIVGGTATSPVDQPVRRIDHVLVRDHVRVGTVDIPAPSPALAAVSDHLPVIVELTVPR
jgi:endonuclease/exonuclease/phosphatase family metal-dependent hydrolase